MTHTRSWTQLGLSSREENWPGSRKAVEGIGDVAAGKKRTCVVLRFKAPPTSDSKAFGQSRICRKMAADFSQHEVNDETRTHNAQIVYHLTHKRVRLAYHWKEYS